MAKRALKKKPAKDLGPAPKKKTGSKTAAIREALKTESSPKVIAEKLQAEGYEINAAYVSTIKTALKKKGGAAPRKPGRPAGAVKKTVPSSGGDPLLSMIDIVQQVGAEEASNLIETAKKVVAKFN